MTITSTDRAVLHIQASAKEVFKVVDVGDTFVVTLALSFGAGQSIGDAAILANIAAGNVVGKRRTATVSQTELSDALHQAAQGGLQLLHYKVVSLNEALKLVEGWRSDGYKVGFANGCFDILHIGHLSILNFSRAQCGRLIVGVNADASGQRLKGEGRPINNERDRALPVAGLSAVDNLVIFGQDTPLDITPELQPDVLAKEADYTIDRLVGAPEVLARRGRVLTTELVPGRSTSRNVSLVEGRPEK